MSFPATFLPLALLLAASLSLAQGIFLEKDESNRLPNQGEIDLARQKKQEALNRLPDATVIRQQFGGVTPRVEAMPRPATPAPDIASIAEKFKSLGRGLASQKGAAPDLMVFVSLSMPREALVRIIDQSERTGATLVFRGLKGDSMTKMGEEIRSLIGNRTVSAAIHPPAFHEPESPPAPNLTPGAELQSWTEEDFITAMRTGMTPNGRHLDPLFMPWQSVGKLDGDELRALWLYLASLPPQQSVGE